MDKIPSAIIRQPRPPMPLTPAAARKEGKINPKRVGGNNRSTHTYYLRSCKRERLTDIESLPDEVLFEVLVRLPAHDICDLARLVCSKWYHMTHTHTFIYTHLQHSTYGLLFQSMDKDPFFMAVGESGRVEISRNRYNKLKYPAHISCNGLVLESQDWENSKLCVLNLATRQIFALPPVDGYILDYYLFAIGYAAASMEYKAALLFTPLRGLKKICCILTIGVDNTWRTIDKESKSLAATTLFFNNPLITEGFVHWYTRNSNEVLTLNVETEIITVTSGPNPKGELMNMYLSTGRYLSLLRPCGEFCWEVWEMKPKIDYRWRKVWDISLEAHKCSTFQLLGFEEYERLAPVGWLKYLEILAFGVRISERSQIIVYNLRTHEISAVEIPAQYFFYNIVVHKNSLVSLGGC